MTRRHAMLIINPSSGRGAIKEVMYDVIARFFRAGWRVTPFISAKAEDIWQFMTEAPAYDLLIAIGGDGTVNDVLNAMMTENIEMPLAYIPSGTTNDLAHSLGLSKDPLEAVEQVISSEAKPMDIGSFADQYFSYVAACGVFTSVAYSTSQDLKNTFGRLAYYIEGLRVIGELGQAFDLSLQFDDQDLHGKYIFAGVTNSRSLGGLLNLDSGLIPVDMADGKMEALLVGAPKTPNDLTRIAHSLRTGQRSTPLVELYQAESFHFSFSEAQPWTLDGEYGGRHRQVQITVIPQRISIHYP